MEVLALGFLILEIISAYIGVNLSRTITSAVNDLYEATVRIREGDLSHRIRVMGNDQLARKVIATVLDTVPGQLAALSEAVAAADTDKARLAAHSIKGSAANAGLPRLSETARRAQQLSEAGEFDRVREVAPELEREFDDLRPALAAFCQGS